MKTSTFRKGLTVVEVDDLEAQHAAKVRERAGGGAAQAHAKDLARRGARLVAKHLGGPLSLGLGRRSARDVPQLVAERDTRVPCKREEIWIEIEETHELGGMKTRELQPML